MSCRRGILEALACAILVSLFYHPLWNFGHMLSGGDAANLFWPIKVIAFESIYQQGVIPLWNPWSFMGSPLAASLQHGIFYPPAWIIYGLFPAHVGLNVDNLFHLILAGTGAWFWLRVALKRDAFVAIAIGAAFPCIQWFWGHQEHINQIATIAYMPWMAACVVLLANMRIDWRTFVLAFGGIGALQFLAGHPQEAFYSHLFSTAIAVGYCVKSTLAVKSVPKPLRSLICPIMAAWLLIGLLVSVQLFQTLELSSHSRRQFKDPLYALSYSMPPDVMGLYLAPHLFGSFRDGYWVDQQAGIKDRRAYNEYGLFIGLPTLLLACVGAGVSFRRRKWLISFLIAAAVVCVALAMGGNTDISRILSLDFTEFPQPGWSLHEIYLRVIPPAEGFRVPARTVIVANFCLLTLAAFGVESIGRYAKSDKQRVGLYSVLGIIVLAALYTPSRKEKFHHLADADPMVTQMRLDRAEIGETKTLDNRHFRLAVGDDDLLISERHLEDTFSRGNPLLTRFQRLKPHSNATIWIPLVDGYEEGLVPTARFKDFIYDFNRNLRQYTPDPTTLKLLGISNVYIDPYLPIDAEMLELDDMKSLAERQIYRVPFVRGAALAESDVAGVDLQRLDGPFWRGGEPLPEFRREPVELGAIPRSPEETGVSTVVDSLNSITIVDVHPSAGPRPLLLAMGWYPGWVHSESEQKVEFINAVHAKLGVETAFPKSADASGHKWNIQFRPFSYLLGLYATMIGVAVWAGLFTTVICRKRRTDV